MPYLNNLPAPPITPYTPAMQNWQITGPAGTTFNTIVDQSGVGTYFSIFTAAPNTSAIVSGNLRMDPFYISGPFYQYLLGNAAYTGVITSFKWFKVKRVEFEFTPAWSMAVPSTGTVGGEAPLPEILVVRDSVSTPGPAVAIPANEQTFTDFQQNADVVRREPEWRRPFKIGYIPYTLALDVGQPSATVITNRTYPWYPVPTAAPTAANANPYISPGYFVMLRFPPSEAQYSFSVKAKVYIIAYDYRQAAAF